MSSSRRRAWAATAAGQPHVMQQGDRIFGSFGQYDPRKMPRHLLWGALHLDYATAVRADTARQDFSVCPRHWYVDATFRCVRCDQPFIFAAEEQRFWYEELKLYVDSRAKHCKPCRRELRELKALRQEYDREVEAALARSTDVERKQRVVAVVDALGKGGVELPEKLQNNRRVLSQQIERLRGDGAA